MEFQKIKKNTPNFFSAVEQQVWDNDWDKEMNMVVPTFFDTLGALSVDMIAQHSDSRIHNTTYEEGAEHGFGVLLVDKGYGSNTPAKSSAQKWRRVQRKRTLINMRRIANRCWTRSV